MSSFHTGIKCRQVSQGKEGHVQRWFQKPLLNDLLVFTPSGKMNGTIPLSFHTAHAVVGCNVFSHYRICLPFFLYKTINYTQTVVFTVLVQKTPINDRSTICTNNYTSSCNKC